MLISQDRSRNGKKQEREHRQAGNPYSLRPAVPLCSTLGWLHTQRAA